MDLITTPAANDVRFSKRPVALEHGSLHLTPHHIIFRSSSPEGTAEIWLPLPLLHSVSRLAPSLTGADHPVVLRTRDFAVYDVHFSSAASAEGIVESLKALCVAMGTQTIAETYASVWQGPSDSKGKGKARGWDVYDSEKEFERMGAGTKSKAWRKSSINSDYEFCPTYPSDIVVPAKISDNTLSYAVKFRSKGRIPGLVYLHWANNGSITRSSQPLTGFDRIGFSGSRSIQDEKLVEAIFTSHSQHSTPRPSRNQTKSPPSDGGVVVFGAQATNVIIDARPETNATANSLKGAGSENLDYYKNCRREFLGIHNIHVVRASLAGVYEALRQAETTGHLDRTALRRTNWLKHLSSILEGASVIARTIHLSNSHALVHCSDGWDRTSQLSALSQLCLDPYFRTGRGFAVLVEKDWLAYGHRFADRGGVRCGDRVDFPPVPPSDPSAQHAFLATVQKQFAGSSHAFKETCPVFAQFLDCVYQIMHQHPKRFAFNERFLRELQREQCTGRTGTFLWNNERERTEAKARETTWSVWPLLLTDETGEWELKPEYRNDEYNSKLDDPKVDDQGVLFINALDVRWWHELFGHEDVAMNGSLEEQKTAVLEAADVVNVEHPIDPPAPLPNVVQTAPRSGSPDLKRSSSPLASRNLPTSASAQAQFTSAVSSFQKFGLGAWRAAQKTYQETIVTYQEQQQQQQQAVSRSASQNDEITDDLQARPSRHPVESSNSGWRAMDDAAELVVPSRQTSPVKPTPERPVSPPPPPPSPPRFSAASAPREQETDPLGSSSYPTQVIEPPLLDNGWTIDPRKKEAPYNPWE